MITMLVAALVASAVLIVAAYWILGWAPPSVHPSERLDRLHRAVYGRERRR
jgi:hypothetical protein